VRSTLEGLSPLRDLMSFVEIVVGPSTHIQLRRLSVNPYLLSLLWFLSLRPALIPLGFPPPIANRYEFPIN
jgi:hypothetical protein